MLNHLEAMLETLGAATDLGHAKRDAAFLRQVRSRCEHPGGTGAGGCTDWASIASAYRFAGNEAVGLAALRRSRREAALAACPVGETVLVINDGSTLDYYHHDSKADRRAVGDGQGKGDEYVCNLGLALESEQLLGVLHDCLISAAGPDDADEIGYQDDPRFQALAQEAPQRLACHHQHIASCHLEHLAQALPGRRLILTADREFDDHFLFEAIYAHQQDFVIRSTALRSVQVADSLSWLPAQAHTKPAAGLPLRPGSVCTSMAALVEHVPLTPFKTIALDAKGRLTDPRTARSYAHVQVGSFRVVLYRQVKRNKHYFTPRDYLYLNVVVVKELDPPPDRDPILWVLYTSLPVGTLEQVAHVVHLYELRWRVECFFKYLKSGFQLEALRYADARKTAIHLVTISIAATFIVNLKQTVGLPAAGLLPAPDYVRVKHAAQHPADSAIPLDLRRFALLATLGGWRGRKNDPINPLTLMRGCDRLGTALPLLELPPEFLRHLAYQWRPPPKCV